MITRTPAQVDNDLARAHEHLDHARRVLTSLTASAQHAFGVRASGTYGSRTRWTTTTEEAWDRVEAAAANGDAYNTSLPTGSHHPSQLLAAREAAVDAHSEIRERIWALSVEYTGWSRFFVVTSSAGHIHSSTGCHTCRDTTTYGWLPNLSGQSEALAVETHGAALCTVCFPSAPVAWVGGRITKAQALKRSLAARE